VLPWDRPLPPAHGETNMDGCIAWPGRTRGGEGARRSAWSFLGGVGRLSRPMVRRADSVRPAMASPLAEEESALLARVAAGDRGPALEELYRRYEARVYGLGLRLLGDQGLAEELVQETFVRLWQQAPRYDAARGTVGSFLFVIARRIAVDLWRRPSSRPFQPEPAQDEAAPGDPVDELIEGLAVRDAMQSLSEPHQQILELFYGQDRRQADIADLLGLPLGTVKTRAYYALRALRLALQERGVHV
jgi:RNA polymerase sigma-70 factor (ECF subfamily)